MNKDFKLFQKYFKEYQKKFGLTGYTVYFEYKPLDKCFAEITVNQDTMVATTRLNSKRDKAEKPFKNIKLDAKHEVLHLLINELEDKGYERYVTKREIYEASESLVNKLAGLIE